MLDASVSGDTSAGGVARVDDAIRQHPDAVLLELGANDALRGIDPKITYANLDTIVTRLEAAHIKIMLLGMRAPANWGHDYQAAFDAIYPRLAAAHHVLLYPFLLDGIALDPKSISRTVASQRSWRRSHRRADDETSRATGRRSVTHVAPVRCDSGCRPN